MVGAGHRRWRSFTVADSSFGKYEETEVRRKFSANGGTKTDSSLQSLQMVSWEMLYVGKIRQGRPSRIVCAPRIGWNRSMSIQYMEKVCGISSPSLASAASLMSVETGILAMNVG